MSDARPVVANAEDKHVQEASTFLAAFKSSTVPKVLKYKQDQERYKGSLCKFCFDTYLKDYSRNYTGMYSHCDCSYDVMYSKVTRDILSIIDLPITIITIFIIKLL
jgi:hypothetical protein